MAYYPATTFVPQFFTDAGVPLSGGTITAYLADTTTPTNMYIDDIGTSGGSVITLNARGEPTVSSNTVVIWLDSAISYKFVLKDASSVSKWTINDIADAGGKLRADLANTSDTSLGVSLVGGAHRVVTSITNLRAVDKTANSLIFVSGYYTAGDGGGGHYRYDSSDTTSTDNGGTIIVGTDSGRWKLIYNDVVHVKQFGAKGDGTTDDTAEIQAAIDACSVIDFGDESNTYKITATIDLSDGNKRLIGTGATIDMQSIPSGNYWGIKAVGSAGSGVAITGATVQAYTVNISNTTGFAVGDYVQLSSSDVYTYGGGSYDVEKGEIKRIRSIVTNTSITFTTPLLDTYTTTPYIHPVTWVDNIHIGGIKLQGSNTAARGERGIVLQYVKNFSVENCTTDGQDFYQIEAASSILGTIRGNKLRSAFYDGATGTIFYGITIIDSAQWIAVTDNVGDRCRHLAITTARTSGQGFYGQPSFISITGNQFFDSMAGGAGRSYAYEIHGFGRFVDVANNQADGCYAGIRVEGGENITVSANQFTNYGYAGIILVGSNGRLLKNCLITNNIIDSYTGEVTSGNPAGLRIEASSATITNLRVSGNIITNSYNATAAAGVGMSIGGNTYANAVFEDNSIDAGSDGNATGIATATSTGGLTFQNNNIYRYRGGYSISGTNTKVMGGSVRNDSAKASGSGLYSNAAKNIFQGVTLENMFLAFSFDTSSINNKCINNQCISCTTTTPSDLGTTNTFRDNDAIA